MPPVVPSLLQPYEGHFLRTALTVVSSCRALRSTFYFSDPIEFTYLRFVIVERCGPIRRFVLDPATVFWPKFYLARTLLKEGDILQPIGGIHHFILIINTVPIVPAPLREPLRPPPSPLQLTPLPPPPRKKRRLLATKKWRRAVFGIIFIFRTAKLGNSRSIGPYGVVVGPPFWCGSWRHQWLQRYLFYKWRAASEGHDTLSFFDRE